ncbi:glyoxalase/bleomycin resistance protein/dioxygenase [Anabaenopsis circularis NIES-21]|uniref:Glyoxalase/bleomycin resistance protein/dioxygenase n=2 Tax=Nostocales TaxID=1161 RepID=A0A1Z4GDA3_9CYAN|nr:VOC family protein [Nostoc cycadae]BAY15462.1 glyoxalase/bleomycin resistance protein/dioxygenase [Anabaenopsis circularis NIES-21]GBE93360.1 glyoxalase/bleomycin resistance protein/dioxygenase [Nostoc cycadae WK-1]
MADIGFTHIALGVTDINKSIAFYQKYAGMKVVHRRTDETNQLEVAWISDLTRPFVIVLLQLDQAQCQPSSGFHLGVACQSREEVDYLCNEAKLENLLQEGPHDWGSPVGYWAFIRDPDGYQLEVAYGQEVNIMIAQAQQQE